jgi:exonuclease SbcC
VKIFEFHVIRYGPVNYKNPFALSDFTLFWGKNEQGKTLTIDALVKLLLGKETKRFDNINRVEGQPSGHVVITVGDKLVKLTAKETLTEVCGISEADCRNIFIVRASDLSIEKDAREKEKEKEADFYAALTDRLTGLKTEQIGRIMKALKNLGKLTPKGDDIRDTQAEPVKARLKKARALIETIAGLEESIGRERFDEMEETLVAARERKLAIENELEAYESARKREDYEKARAAYDQLTASLAKLKELENITEEDERAWSDAVRDLKRLSESKAGTAEALAALKERRDKLFGDVAKRERDLALLSDRKKRIDDEIVPELKNYEMGSGEVGRRSGNRRFYTVWALCSAAVTAGSLFGLATGPSALWYVLSALSGASLVVSLIYLVLSTRQESWLSGMHRRIAVAASKYNLAAPTIEGIYAKIQHFSDDYHRAEGELNRLLATRGSCDDQIAKISEHDLPEIEGKISESQRVIETIGIRTGFESAPDLRAALRGKREYEENRGGQARLLRNIFGDQNLSLREYLPLWKKGIDTLSAFKDVRTDLDYNDAAVSSLKGERVVVEQTIDTVNGSLSHFRKELAAVEREAEGLFPDKNEPVPVETSVDLGVMRRRLERLIAGIETDRDDARAALSVFEGIEAEERQQVSLLFGEDSAVSRYFSTITGGLYDAVTFDNEDGAVHVRSRDGSEFPADKLSSGAYDQLYLAIRLALGERLVSDGAGFFIMDDPFIRSDPERLARQMAMLSDIARKGWQVIYFSSKGEVKEALTKEIKKGAVTLFEL